VLITTMMQNSSLFVVAIARIASDESIEEDYDSMEGDIVQIWILITTSILKTNENR